MEILTKLKQRNLKGRLIINNKLIGLVLFLVFLLVSIVLYRNMGEEMRANVIFFGLLILACLVGGLLVVSGIKYFFSSVYFK